jgi:hypothetical protein
MPVVFEKPVELIKQVESYTQQEIIQPQIINNNSLSENTWLYLILFSVIILWLSKPFWGLLLGLLRIAVLFFVFTVGLYFALLL